jgi:hypothetical protein
MVKVEFVGNARYVANPQNGTEQEMIPITFVEHSNREGGNADLSKSSAVLDEALGIQTGLPQFRTHTQLVTPEAARQLTLGREFPTLHINRNLTSFPTMIQQKDAKPRLVDGKPTFFNTTLDNEPRQDKDERLDNNVCASMFPHYFTDAQLGSAAVTTTNEAGERNGDNRQWESRQKSANSNNAGSPSLQSSGVGVGEKSQARQSAAQGT